MPDITYFWDTNVFILTPCSDRTLQTCTRVKNWEQRYAFSISKKSSKKLVYNWSSLCKLTNSRAYFLLNKSAVVSANGHSFWHPKDLPTNFNFHIVKSPLAFFKNLEKWSYFDEVKVLVRKQPIFLRNRLFLPQFSGK